VGDGAVITAGSGIPGDVPPGAIHSGKPAVDNRLWLKVTAALNRLPDTIKRVRELEAEVKELKAR
jgi:UDP-3-O-[3-hydroxymyristoyl] glucosamine N-acyltransferase